MGFILKDYTGREIFEAIEKDGFRILREAWIEGKGADIGACLLGMAGLNLGVAASFDMTKGQFAHLDNNLWMDHTLISQLNQVETEYDEQYETAELGDLIVARFDAARSLTDLAEDKIVAEGTYYPTGGTTALFDHWYDERNRAESAIAAAAKENGTLSNDGHMVYDLTWQQSIEMVRELLSPHFNKVFHLLEYDYSEDYEWTPPTV